MIFADIIVDVSVKNLDREFQYIVPKEMEEQIQIGMQVIIPFGRGDRKITGFVIGLSDKPKFDLNRTKSIIEVKKQGVVVESHLLSLAYWIKERYGSTMNDAIKTVIPVKQKVKEKIEKTVFINISKEKLYEYKTDWELKHYAAKVRVLESFLSEQDAFVRGIDNQVLIRRWKITKSVLDRLEKDGIITVKLTRSFRQPIKYNKQVEKNILLNDEQKKIIDEYKSDIQSEKICNYLIHGVTGSGKTEVYMAMIEEMIKEKKQTILLVPEIALTFQMVNRFYERFGENVSVMHSRLSSGEKYDQFLKAKEGKIQIMIGPRSAIFTPFTNLGLIIVDEEHEDSYRSESMPCYDAREVACRRGEMIGASVVLGSATPSLESYYAAKKGIYKLFELTKRAAGAEFPKVSIVDLREEFEKKNYSIFSAELQDEINNCLAKKEQVMLFINRRGYGGFVSCRKCGSEINCQNCSVTMKPHKRKGKLDVLKCHYCGSERPIPRTCPVCGSKYIGVFGIGSQQVESMAKETFKGARVLRMDADTTTGKEGHRNILEEFSRGDADILVGTQMIVKGHDFSNVTLVGILAADLSLFAGDYRAAEKTFQLLTQAAGRAGRGKKAGKAIIQTYQPDHYSIVAAANENYIEFYEREVLMRQMLQYPPFSHILEVMVSSENQRLVHIFADEIKALIPEKLKVTVLGPADANIYKVNNSYRRMLYIKGTDMDLLCYIRKELERYKKVKQGYKDCNLQFNIR